VLSAIDPPGNASLSSTSLILIHRLPLHHWGVTPIPEEEEEEEEEEERIIGKACRF